MGKDKETKEEQTLTRIAIVNSDKCKPSKCRQECKKSCPVVRMGKFCIEVGPKDKIAYLSEELCIGCGICVKKCPFDAILIINLPKNLSSNTTHRYSANSFKLHRLPMPRAGQVLGLVGSNGIGKSTALKILAGKQKPNLGRFASPPDWQEILTHFRGSELQNYFTKILEDDMKVRPSPRLAGWEVSAVWCALCSGCSVAVGGDGWTVAAAVEVPQKGRRSALCVAASGAAH